MSVITVEKLRYRYPHTKELALDGIDFSVEKGEFIGIIGENGAGKSTLSQAIMGLVPQFYKGAYGGKVMVDGLEAGKTPVAQLCGHVGLVFQNPFNQLSGAKDNVYEEVAFGMQNLGVPAEEMKKRVEEALKLPGTKVLMKAGKQMKYVQEQVKDFGKNAVMIENCGMPDEKIYASGEEIPESAGYYSLIIVKEEGKE